MIEVSELTKIFKSGLKEIRAVDGISFKINKGSFVTITGRSGSGKSTLLYQLGLLDNPTSGSIIIKGTEVSQMSDKEKSIFRLKNLGYVFQDYALIPTLTAKENVLIPLIMMDLNNTVAERYADEALENVGLKDRKNNLPSQLSGGEQQRVSIARAISNSPEILFADEPTANLDTETADVVLKVLTKLNKQGITLVMVTHEPEYAALGNKTMELLDGKLVN